MFYLILYGFAIATNSSFCGNWSGCPVPIGLERFDEAFRDVYRKSDAELLYFYNDAQGVEDLNGSTYDAFKRAARYFDRRAGLECDGLEFGGAYFLK